MEIIFVLIKFYLLLNDVILSKKCKVYKLKF